MTIDHSSLFIGSHWVRPAASERITVRSASTEEIIGSVPEAVPADVDSAVSAARTAFEDAGGWAGWTAERRAELLDRFADEYDKRSEEIVYAVSQQNGMPITLARVLEAVSPPSLLRYYAGLIRQQPFEEERAGVFVRSTVVRRQPIGVVAAIVPWNVPQTLAMTKLAPALAAGCTVVLKPSPETVLDAYVLAAAAEAAGVPEGVLSIVPGGRELGAYLVTHPGVDKVTFTGSTDGGRAVAGACAPLFRPVTLELGGKSAAIILDDAELDLQKMGQSLFLSTLANNGQACFLGTRVLAPRSRYGEVVDFFAALIGNATVGDALDDSTQIGPLASRVQQSRVSGYIDTGIRDGARVVVGGLGMPDRCDRGWFVRPTLFADVDNSDTIAQEEIFGPVLSVIQYDGDDDAVRIANDSRYGLGGTVWSPDEDRAMTVASAVQSGTIGINGYFPDPTAPFGGIKQSGLGREYGPEGLASFQQTKSIYRI